MNIHINPSSTVKDLKADFRERFENLKLEFFYHAHEEGEGSPKKDQVPNDVQLSSLMKDEHDGDIFYTASTTISALEQLFARRFGLNVQVFRFAGQTWLETMNSDSWTLQRANDRVKELHSD